ncbi:steroid 5-alpha-reductase DET2 [Chenopodium quinoa]|uniref:steroid 5-alpha-reductase DET2 n=1 Tax=Chenopodium quinoa TaxID=63459 RepID=UPI000B796518|nr:steroid 5-alpha-reductase DET2 [Chenopodium quinoa]
MSPPSASADATIYNLCLLTLYLIALPTFLALHFIQAPYGRHRRSGWGPTIPSWLSWLLMESPTIFFSLLIYPFGQFASSLRSFSLLAVFLLHYFHRTVVYPLRLRRKTTSDFPISVSLMAFSFNLLNSYVQTRWISNYCDYGLDEWFWGRFSGGMVVFGFGMVLNVKSDLVLVGLKAQGGGYKIPRGGLFELVSSPNYLGEIIEWLGWAIMTWSWAGFGFFLYTFCNLVPRAMANHKWYLEKFKDEYPKTRKAIIPFMY